MCSFVPLGYAASPVREKTSSLQQQDRGRADAQQRCIGQRTVFCNGARAFKRTTLNTSTVSSASHKSLVPRHLLYCSVPPAERRDSELETRAQAVSAEALLCCTVTVQRHSARSSGGPAVTFKHKVRVKHKPTGEYSNTSVRGTGCTPAAVHDLRNLVAAASQHPRFWGSRAFLTRTGSSSCNP